MYGKTGRAEQHRERVASFSTRPSAKGFGLLGEGSDYAATISKEEQLLNEKKVLSARYANITDELSTVKSVIKLTLAGTPRAKELMEKREKLMKEFRATRLRLTQITDLLKPLHSQIAVEHAFVEEAQRVLTKANFDTIMKLALAKVNSSKVKST